MPRFGNLEIRDGGSYVRVGVHTEFEEEEGAEPTWTSLSGQELTDASNEFNRLAALHISNDQQARLDRGEPDESVFPPTVPGTTVPTSAGDVAPTGELGMEVTPGTGGLEDAVPEDGAE